jgi:hypothetical protein
MNEASAKSCEEFGGILASAMIDNMSAKDKSEFNAWKATIIQKVKEVVELYNISPWYDALNVIRNGSIIDEDIAAALLRAVSGNNRPRKVVLLNAWKRLTRFHPKVNENANSVKTIHQLVGTVFNHEQDFMDLIPADWLDASGFESSLDVNNLIFVGYLKDLLYSDICAEKLVVTNQKGTSRIMQTVAPLTVVSTASPNEIPDSIEPENLKLSESVSYLSMWIVYPFRTRCFYSIASYE